MFEGLLGLGRYKAINAKDLKAKLDSKEKFLIFDVRSKEEYAAGHIPHSISVPGKIVGTSVSKLARTKDIEIVVYCQNGVRAAKAAAALSEAGYRNVRNFGSISSWKFDLVQ